MKKIVKRVLALVLIVATLSIVLPTTTYAYEKNANNYIYTTIDSYRDDVDVYVDLSSKSNFTSGQVVVYYDPEVLSLNYALQNTSLDMSDLNVSYTDNSVSFAWASDTADRWSETLMMLNFTAVNAYNGEKVSVLTDVVNAYQNFTALPTGEDVTTTETLSMPKRSSLLSWLFGLDDTCSEVERAIEKICVSVWNLFW